MESVVVSFLVVIDATANPIAQSAAAINAGSKEEKFGLATIKIPTNPVNTARNLTNVNFSFKLFINF